MDGYSKTTMDYRKRQVSHKSKSMKYDPSNPVVLYSGSLWSYECSWMENDAETADLALVLGTSLSGLNADQVATKTASRSLQSGNKRLRGHMVKSHGNDGAIGMAMINLQQTTDCP